MMMMTTTTTIIIIIKDVTLEVKAGRINDI
jgi:hypothetical protein